MRSIHSPSRSQSFALSLYAERILRTTSSTSGQRGGLFGRFATTSLWNVGFERAFECLPPTQTAILVESAPLICIGGQGGGEGPQPTHLVSSAPRHGLA